MKVFSDDYRQSVTPHVRSAMDRLRDPQAVWDIFRDPATIAEMKRLTALKQPAVAAASARLLALGDWVRGHDAKRTFGKIARSVMEASGYAAEQGGVPTPQDPLFSKGTRYGVRQPEPRGAGEATLTLRNFDRVLQARLAARAHRNRRSPEAEAAQILSDVLAVETKAGEPNLAEAIHRRFADLGGVEDLEPYPDMPAETPPGVDR